MGWKGFRLFLADKIVANCSHPHAIRHAELLRDTDYEGPELFNVGVPTVHGMYEEMRSGIASGEYDGLKDWWRWSGAACLRSWLIETAAEAQWKAVAKEAAKIEDAAF